MRMVVQHAEFTRAQIWLLTAMAMVLIPMAAIWLVDAYRACPQSVRRLVVALLVAAGTASALRVVTTQIYISCDGWNRFLIECWF